jgi:predicted TIM-barrel fold metal-dependent hydrolase
MIIDSHTHIFENWSGACGLPSREVHWKYIQKSLSRPAAKIFRYRDGAVADSTALYRSGSTGWDGLRDDVDFRVGPFGRIEFTVDGEQHYIQYMPPGMADIESTPEFLITQMNVAGVGHCVLQGGFTYGYMNDYNALAQHQFPGRFTGLFHVDEARADQPYWINETHRAIEKLDLKGLHYQLEQFSRYGFDVWFDDPRFDPFWSLIDQSGLPVFLEISPIPNYDLSSYLAVMARFSNLLDRYSRIRWVLVMAPPIQYFARDGMWNIPAEVARIFTHERVYLEACYPISWGGIWDYPYVEIRPLIHELKRRFGAGKLVWGSDMPNVERFCTYKQSLDYLRLYCGFFTAGEMDRVLGGNLAELLGISDRQAGTSCAA